MSAANLAADTAEAGLFQVSFNSASAHSLLQALFEQYKGSTDFQNIFADGVICRASDWRNWGVGDGAQFQALTKACPGFAVEYAALGLRKIRSHWGPINRKRAELRPEADDLFRSVHAYIDAHGLGQI